MARQTYNHLVIVCCHGIWLGGPKRGFDESEWLIESFRASETPTFIQHIKAGLRVLKDDDSSVLMFSGAPTNDQTSESEAASYAKLAAANWYFDLLPPQDSSRIYVESRALDSYHNVLFSIIQFWYNQGHTWPERITIVSHDFKRERLVDCHCSAIRFPLDCVGYFGVDPPDMIDGSNVAAMDGVRVAVEQWKEDPHGSGELLAGKRRRRNPWAVDQALFRTDEDRARSGVRSEWLKDSQEHLVDGAPQPWSRESA